MQKKGNGAASSKNEVACLVVVDRSSDEGKRLVRISRNRDLEPRGPLWCEVVPRVVVEMMEARGRYVCAFAISRKGTTSGIIEIVVTDNLLDLQHATLPRMIRSTPEDMVFDMQLSLPPMEVESIREAIAQTVRVSSMAC
jgi:hypothetical protein